MHFLVPTVKGIEPSENWLRQVFFLSEGEYEAFALMVRGLKQNDPMYAYVFVRVCVYAFVYVTARSSLWMGPVQTAGQSQP